MTAAGRQARLTDPPTAGDRGQGFRTIGAAVSKLAAPIAARRGGGVLVRLKADWSEIVGREWALIAWPLGYNRDGVLKLRSLPSAALELQHRAPYLIERINLFFGRIAVRRLVLIQGTLPLPAEVDRSEPLAAGDSAASGPELAGIADPTLRAALARLGRAVGWEAG